MNGIRRSPWQRAADALEAAFLSGLAAAAVGYGVATALGCLLMGTVSEPLELAWLLFVTPGTAVAGALAGAVLGALRPRRIGRWLLLLGLILAATAVTELALIVSGPVTPGRLLRDLVNLQTLAFFLGTASAGVLTAALVSLVLSARGPQAVNTSRLVMGGVILVALALAGALALAAYSADSRSVNGISVGPDGRIYAATNAGLFTADAAATRWHRLPCSGWRNLGVHDVAAHPQRPGILLAQLAEAAVSSDDGGETWQPLPATPHPSVIAASPHGLYAANDEWLLVRVDPGHRWQSHRWGRAQATCLAVSADNPGLMLIGSRDFSGGKGPMLTHDGGRTWQRTRLPAGATSGIMDLAFVPTTPEVMLVVASNVLLASIDGEDSWRPVTNVGSTWFSKARILAVAATKPPTIYVVTESSLRVSADLCRTWRDARIRDDKDRSGVQCVAVDPSDSHTVYVGFNDGLYRSRDDGRSWRRIR
ncbi:MAG TPA: hypothetical protein VM221_06025 [Armatimonadota bacterium]|nr:hypothetical protein [Armatimonadota bacterium]